VGRGGGVFICVVVSVGVGVGVGVGAYISPFLCSAFVLMPTSFSPSSPHTHTNTHTHTHTYTHTHTPTHIHTYTHTQVPASSTGHRVPVPEPGELQPCAGERDGSCPQVSGFNRCLSYRGSGFY
jgi:hypothetical protein